MHLKKIYGDCGYYLFYEKQRRFTKPFLMVEGRGCCHRPQNEQIYLPQSADFYETVLKATDLIFAGAVDL